MVGLGVPEYPVTAAAAWGNTLSGLPTIDRVVRGLVPGHVRQWQNIAPDIEQLALDHHYISIHLGGPKILTRRGDGGAQIADAAEGSHSIVPAGSAYRWETRGPINFMHIYIAPNTLAQVIAHAFDRDPSRIALAPALGCDDRLVASLGAALCDELGHENPQQAYIDDLMHLIICRTLRLHSNARGGLMPAQHALPPYRLRRAIDFMEENIARQIGVTEIADASGISLFHFSRSFRAATGKSPYSYLLNRRIEMAKARLLSGDDCVKTVAAECGFANSKQLSRMFKREAGLSPTTFRRRR